MQAPALLLSMLVVTLTACSELATLPVGAGTGVDPTLPSPHPTLVPTMNIAPAVGWPPGTAPQPPTGTRIQAFARNLDHPRWLYVLPNGDVLVAESNTPAHPTAAWSFKAWVTRIFMAKAGAGGASANRITLLRDTHGTGTADVRTVLLDGLNSPFGMVLVGNDLYVANTDAILRFTYTPGSTRIAEPGEVVARLPGGPINHHWTKNIIASPDGKLLYVAIGSNSNVGENGMEAEAGRAAVWEVDLHSGAHRIFASGLRNPVGLAWEPLSGVLWTTVNERDEIGSDLVPDYMTGLRDGAFYGWPYSYYGQHVDVRAQPPQPAMVASAVVPDYALGPHTASLGLASSEGTTLPAPFAHGMFVGQHGSWNRRPHSGYKVIFVPFSAGKPSGAPIDVLTGFLSEEGTAYGRPVGVTLDRTGALLVADDVGNVIWRVQSAPL
jgi:glucose/arabinose dehydrogenase